MKERKSMSRCVWTRVLEGSTVVMVVLGLWVGQALANEKQTGWSGEVNLNLSNLTGTNDTFAGTVNAEAARAWEKDTLKGTARGEYGVTRDRRNTPSEDETTQNAQTVALEWQRDLGERLFFSTNTRAGRDSIQDINFQYRVSSGPGYRFWQGENEAKEHLDLSTRVGYRFVTFRDSTDEDTLNLVDLIASFEYKNLILEDRLEIGHSGEILLPANDIDSWVGQTMITLGVPITASWSMRVGFELEYQARTPDEVSNFTTRTTAGLAYKF